MADWAIGRGLDYIEWPIIIFKRIFTDEIMNDDVNTRAMIYAMGGPLPSRLESYDFSLNLSQQTMRINLKMKTNGIRSVYESNHEGEEFSGRDVEVGNDASVDGQSSDDSKETRVSDT